MAPRKAQPATTPKRAPAKAKAKPAVADEKTTKAAKPKAAKKPVAKAKPKAPAKRKPPKKPRLPVVVQNLGGRPSSFDVKMITQAEKLAKLGATDLEVAQFFEVSVRTLYRWKIENDDFRAAMEMGKEAADAKVEQSLFRRAVGYSFDSEKIVVVDKEVVRLDTIEHVPPDTKAALAWLYNRRPAEWRTTQHHKHDVAPESPLAQFLREISGNTIEPVHEERNDAGHSSILPVDDDDV
jgi:hypothetical protein